MRLLTLMILCALAAGVTGCDTRGVVDLPENFVLLEQNGPYDLRGVSADGVVIGVSSRPNLANGTLTFWQEATEGELVRRGYDLADTEDITSAGGIGGRLMGFNTRSRGADFTYLLAVYVTSDRVVTVEAGGPNESFARHAGQIRTSLLSLR